MFDEGTFNNTMENGAYKQMSVNEDYGTGLFQRTIRYKTEGENNRRNIRFDYIVNDSEKTDCDTEL